MDAFSSWTPFYGENTFAKISEQHRLLSFPSPNNAVEYLDVDASSPQDWSQDWSQLTPTNRCSSSVGAPGTSSFSPSSVLSRPASAIPLSYQYPSDSCRDTVFDSIKEIDGDSVFSNSTWSLSPTSLSCLAVQTPESGCAVETPEQVSVDDWANWRDWDIKTTLDCPPLDQLFENKRIWRERFNAAVPPNGQRYCVFCRSMKKSPLEYKSHNVRDAQGIVTCPVLGIYQCPNCGEKGHTVRYCLKPQNDEKIAKSREESLKHCKPQSEYKQPPRIQRRTRRQNYIQKSHH